MRELNCAHVLTAADRPASAARTIRIDGESIAAIEAARPAEPFLAMPPLANAHDHARTVRSSSLGASSKPLETWLHYLALVPSIDPYLAAAVSLARSALGGAGVVMVHYTRVHGFTDLPAEAKEVARAARDVGVRVGFAVALRDRNPLVYGPSEPILAALPALSREEIARKFIRTPLPVKEMITLVDAVAAAAGSSVFDVQYGPNAVQWCTTGLLEAVAEASAGTGRRVHMHLLETRYQRSWADAEFPDGIVRYLDGIGLLSPRLTLAHCTWARPDELELNARPLHLGAARRARAHCRARGDDRRQYCLKPRAALGNRPARGNGAPRLPRRAGARRSCARRRRRWIARHAASSSAAQRHRVSHRCQPR